MIEVSKYQSILTTHTIRSDHKKAVDCHIQGGGDTKLFPIMLLTPTRRYFLTSRKNVLCRYLSSKERLQLPQSHGHDRLLEGKKVLIANRGEISMRISRAVNALGATSIAVCAPEDKDSPHVAFADEMVILPKGKTAIAPYLDIAALTKASTDLQADFVHPG